MPRATPTALALAFLPYAALSAIHIVLLALGSPAAEPTKLLLMPALLATAAFVVWRTRAIDPVPFGILAAALVLSWLGEGAGTLFPAAPTLPLMLAFFGAAHLAYIWLFSRPAARRRLPAWTIVYAAWWVTLLLVLLPYLGALTVGVGAYGIVLALTAALSARCHPLTALGGALFLASDTILAFRLFLASGMPEWTSPAVMITYCAGQALLVAGLLRGGVPARPAALPATAKEAVR